MKLTRKAGLTPETHEFVFLHVHSHLDVFVNGNPVRVPSGIGIAIHDPAVNHAKLTDGTMAYGGISPPCAQPCISPLHTHYDDGILHTEAKQNQFNNLGEFFTEWNVRLDDKCVGGYCKPAAPISPSSIRKLVSRNSPPSSAAPPSIRMSVTMLHFVSGRAHG